MSVAVAIAAVGLLGPVSAEAEGGAEVPATVAPARIGIERVQEPASGHSFTFSVLRDDCPTPLLEFDHATVAERPAIGVHKGAAIVTAYMRWPAHRELEPGQPCPPEAPIHQVVHIRTKRAATSLVFFDGSSSPPRRVFPPPSR